MRALSSGLSMIEFQNMFIICLTSYHALLFWVQPSYAIDEQHLKELKKSWSGMPRGSSGWPWWVNMVLLAAICLCLSVVGAAIWMGLEADGFLRICFGCKASCCQERQKRRARQGNWRQAWSTPQGQEQRAQRFGGGSKRKPFRVIGFSGFVYSAFYQQGLFWVPFFRPTTI